MKKNAKAPEYIAIIFGVVAMFIALREIMIMQFIDLAMEPLYAEIEGLERMRLFKKAGPYMFSSVGMVFGYHYARTQGKKSIGLIISAGVHPVMWTG